MDELSARFVAPFYRRMISNLHHPDKRDQQLAAMRLVAAEVTPAVALELWSRADWRSNQMASWWATVWAWPEAVPVVKGLLLPSRLVYAGRFHCLLLARVGTRDAAGVLAEYLDYYLPHPELRYDQAWAVAALTRVDEKRGTRHVEQRQEAWRSWLTLSGCPEELPAQFQSLRDALLELAAQVASP